MVTVQGYLFCSENYFHLWYSNKGGICILKRKKLFYCITIIILISAVIYFYPRSIKREYTGIMYRIGDTNYSENVKIKIYGKLTKGLFRGDNFKGSITIGEKQLNKINMRFDSSHRGNLYYDEGVGAYKNYGSFISDNMKDEFTICVLEDNNKKSGSSSWSSADGLMVSAPASSRNDAINISNKLMQDILVHKIN